MNITRAKTKQTGSMILEALIAILIFSIGILSLVGMEATAINTVADAKYRSTAGFFADQMVGTIWATRLGTTVANASNVIAASPDPGYCYPAACAGGSAQAAAWTTTWVSGVQANLPNGTAIVSMVSANTVMVTVGWQPPKDAHPHAHTVLTFIN